LIFNLVEELMWPTPKKLWEFKFLKYESKGKMNKRVQFTLD